MIQVLHLSVRFPADTGKSVLTRLNSEKHGRTRRNMEYLGWKTGGDETNSIKNCGTFLPKIIWNKVPSKRIECELIVKWYLKHFWEFKQVLKTSWKIVSLGEGLLLSDSFSEVILLLSKLWFSSSSKLQNGLIFS